MTYKTLPPVGKVASHLPRLEFAPTPNMSSRFGVPIRKVWLHRWAGGQYDNIVHYLQNPHVEASAHLVYPGSQDWNHCAQLVPFGKKAWTEEVYNRSGVSIECEDAIWLGHDAVGFCQLARITAYLLHRFGLPPVWAHTPKVVPFNYRRGMCRHADGGIPAGGHTQCPTTDLELWGQFVGRTQAEYRRGEFRKAPWGRY